MWQLGKLDKTKGGNDMVHFKYLRWGIGIYGVLKAPTTWKSVKCKMVGY